jgi:hypothetical protein
MKRALLVCALALVAACARSNDLDRTDVVDGLVARDFTRPQAECIADRIFDEYRGARRQELIDDLDGDHIRADDRAVLTASVDACVAGIESG